MNRPVIGITIGEPAGIGSEIVVKLLNDPEVFELARPLVIGSRFLLEEGLRITGLRRKLQPLTEEEIRSFDFPVGVIAFIDLNNITAKDFMYGKISAKAGKAAGDYIERAVKLAVAKEIEAIVTCPIHKESFCLGGWGKKYPGHTEMISDLTGTKKYAMMLACGNLRVVHVSTHVSLRQAVEACRRERVLETIRLADCTLKKMGMAAPRIGVAGLNPHAGDGGLFGDEEIKEIIPAVELARQEGIDVSGPWAADTVFCKAKGGMFDIVVAMYHDQGHIPLKYAGFIYNDQSATWDVRGINVTVGLPIIRVSVDHGTAFGKAGQGRADHSSLKDAFLYALKMAENYHRSGEPSPRPLPKGEGEGRKN